MHLVRLAAVVIAGLSKAPLQGIQRSHDAQQLVAQTGMIPFDLQAESARVLTLLCCSNICLFCSIFIYCGRVYVYACL